MSISQVTTVKGRWEQVQRNLPKWLASGVDEVVLVDYACPQGSGKRAVRQFKDDPRLTVVNVDETIAGTSFHLTRARNIGAVAARHELLFFLDADAGVSDSFIDRAGHRMGTADVLVNDTRTCDEEYVHHHSTGLPARWAHDGQCLINNSLFFLLNGYNEQLTTWGGESYDLYIRAASHGARVGNFERTGMYVTPHPDAARNQFLSTKIPPGVSGRDVLFRQNLRELQKSRRISRTNPGNRMGATAAHANHIQLIRAGRPRAWNPGEDDSTS